MLPNKMTSCENGLNDSYIYINPSVLFYFNQTRVELEPLELIVIDCSELVEKKLSLAVTDEPLEALQLKQKYACDICFINNHGNDSVDFTPTYEISSEEVSRKLQKLLTNHQNGLKNN